MKITPIMKEAAKFALFRYTEKIKLDDRTRDVAADFAVYTACLCMQGIERDYRRTNMSAVFRHFANDLPDVIPRRRAEFP